MEGSPFDVGAGARDDLIYVIDEAIHDLGVCRESSLKDNNIAYNTDGLFIDSVAELESSLENNTFHGSACWMGGAGLYFSG